ncbi:MAG: peptidoglycan DD-metalloendopeptidase family protein [bacterium]|nr:peptidoglycan DD-metalloendopeptidase family protein [bacterium]
MLCLSVPARAEPFLWLPYEGRRSITCDFTCYAGHRAIDFGLPTSTEVLVAAGGEVTLVRDGVPLNAHPPRQDYGNQVRIRHPNGYITIYAHFAPGTLAVRRGDHVEAGQPLGRSDNTGKSSGPHLHFEVRDASGRRVNPYGDPSNYTTGCGPNALWMTCPPTPAPPPDADGDGFTAAQGDCNDSNRDVHPGGIESCNGLDDDCSGTSDDPWHDGDDDDVGNPCSDGEGICERTGLLVCYPDGSGTRCDAVPGEPSPESCNGLDDDCDGTVDDPWRTGLAQDVGNECVIAWDACRGDSWGEWVCAPGGLSTVCNASEPDGRRPTDETCNGVDDDCNGTVDDPWRVGLTQDIGNACEVEIPVCGVVSGFWQCTPDGLATVCTPTEICNGRDDNCNGWVDDVAPDITASDPNHCGACFRPCADPFTQCSSGFCYIGCGTQSLCMEYCRILHCPNCGGYCGDGLSTCVERCRSIPGYLVGNDWSAQSCACRGCQSCCCVSAGGFTECRNPCR